MSMLTRPVHHPFLQSFRIHPSRIHSSRTLSSRTLYQLVSIHCAANDPMIKSQISMSTRPGARPRALPFHRRLYLVPYKLRPPLATTKSNNGFINPLSDCVETGASSTPSLLQNSSNSARLSENWTIFVSAVSHITYYSRLNVSRPFLGSKASPYYGVG